MHSCNRLSSASRLPGVNSVRRPTLADVAAAAGVSRATASRALSDNPNVNGETRERVWAAAQRLAFEPNHLARSLRTRSSRLVGMLLPDIAVASYAAALAPDSTSWMAVAALEDYHRLQAGKPPQGLRLFCRGE